jgi:NADPH-dependent ferric siderophore reductase
VEVVSVSRIAPRLVSVLVNGGDLSRFADAPPTSHIKVFLPAVGQDAPTMPSVGPDGARVWPQDQPRPVVRTYTPRSFDPEIGTLEVQFLLHGAGPASEWAETARPGSKAAIGGPGGRFSLDLEASHWFIAGDESALPAVGTLLDTLPASTTAEVHLEVTGPEDEIPFASPADATITWHHRRAADAWGTELYEATAGASIPDGAQVWVACEASAVRTIRRHLLVERQVSTATTVTRGYWRVGAADHPDHDYGED